MDVEEVRREEEVEVAEAQMQEEPAQWKCQGAAKHSCLKNEITWVEDDEEDDEEDEGHEEEIAWRLQETPSLNGSSTEKYIRYVFF